MTSLPYGGFAEMAVVAEREALDAWPSLDDASMAASYVNLQTAWFALHRRAQIRSGETILVHAAAGGVGMATIAVGKAAGAKIIAVVGSRAKMSFLTKAGVYAVINRNEDDIARAVNELTGGRGADVVVDPVGGPSYTASTKCIAFEGRIVVLGFTSGSIPTAALNHAMIKNYSIHGLHWGSYVKRDEFAWREANRQLAELSKSGLLRAIHIEPLEFSSVPAGLARIASGSVIGKLVFKAKGS